MGAQCQSPAPKSWCNRFVRADPFYERVGMAVYRKFIDRRVPDVIGREDRTSDVVVTGLAWTALRRKNARQEPKS